MTEPRDNPFRRKRRPAPEKTNDSRGFRGKQEPRTEPRRDDRGPRRDDRGGGQYGTHGQQQGPSPKRGRRVRDERKAGREGVVRNPERGRGLRQLPRDMSDLAAGKIERLRSPRGPGQPLVDERVGHVLRGVGNKDARTVYDARVAHLRACVANGERSALVRGLAEARRMGLWRARAVTDFAAFAESVVGIASAEAEELTRGVSDQPALPEDVIALWMRLEAALARACPDASVSVSGSGDTLAFELRIAGNDVSRAVEGFFDMGGAALGLRRFLRETATPARDASRDRPTRS